METSKLYKMAIGAGVAIDFCSLTHTKAFCIDFAGHKHIAVDKGFAPDSAEERVIIAHELGHISTDSLYDQTTPELYRFRYERKADVWAIHTLVPLPLLKSALKQGIEGISALSEHFSVTEEFMQKAIRYYSEISL